MEHDAWKQQFFNDRMPACPLKGHWLTFCLVDETGSGKGYGGCLTQSMMVRGNSTEVG